MGFRFQKRISTPFGRINLSKSGVSLTEGVPGAHVTIGRRPRITLSIPGSGISWTETMEHGRRASSPAPQAAPQARPGWQVALIVVALLGVLMIILGGGGHPRPSSSTSSSQAELGAAMRSAAPHCASYDARIVCA
jgi:hypothetical protein